MHIEALLTPDAQGISALKNEVVVVVDVLRATSTMLSAFEMGISHIIPVENVETAHALKLEAPGCLVAGEVNSIKPDGFDFDNSPVSLCESGNLTGKTLVMRTTNGTRLLKQLQTIALQNIWIGSFANVEALTHQWKTTGKDLVICCAGDNGEESFEDTAFAGALIDEILKTQQEVRYSKSAQYALNRWRGCNQSVQHVFQQAPHAEELRRLGKQADLDFIAQFRSSRIPRFDCQASAILLEYQHTPLTQETH